MKASWLENILPFLPFTSAEIGACEDMFDGDPAGDVIRFTEADEIIFLICKAAGATGTAAITVESCDDFTPSTATAIAFKSRSMTTNGTWGALTERTSAGFTTTAGANQVYAIAVRAADLVDGHVGVRLKMTEVVNSPVDGFVAAFFCRQKTCEDINAVAFLS